MITIKLPDGSEKSFESPTNGLEIAESIGAGLAKASVAININGLQCDLSDQIINDAEVSLITINSDEGLEIMRHTLTAQVLARAVKNLYPNARLAIGPTIEDGFYYDFFFENQLSVEDLPKIELEMKKIIASEESIEKSLVPRSFFAPFFIKDISNLLIICHPLSFSIDGLLNRLRITYL